jgi:hypothetical protein
MTKIPGELVANWPMLRQIWYRSIVPDPRVDQFKAFAWKVLVIGSGDSSERPILLGRLSDQTKINASFDDMKTLFLPEPEYIKFVEEKNYKLADKTDSELVFITP